MKLLIAFGVGILLSLPALPDSIPVCQIDTLTSYEALASGCLIGDLVFSGFSYNDNTLLLNPTLVPASAVTVTPISGLTLGLRFRAISAPAQPKSRMRRCVSPSHPKAACRSSAILVWRSTALLLPMD